MASRRSNSWLAVLAMVAGLSVPAPAARAGLIGEQQEIQMGNDAARQIEARYRLSSDGQASSLVERMGTRLAQVSSRPRLPWKFRVIENKEVNALSVPGHVYINSGLLSFIGGDRDELAAVVAHEIAHTTRKHAVRQSEKALVGSLALRLLFKNDRSLAANLAGTAANLALLGYGRKAELEADRHGADYMIQAGYDPRGMIRFFEKLRARQGKESKGLATYFRTHPPTSERIRKVREHLAQAAAGPPLESASPQRETAFAEERSGTDGLDAMMRGFTVRRWPPPAPPSAPILSRTPAVRR